MDILFFTQYSLDRFFHTIDIIILRAYRDLSLKQSKSNRIKSTYYAYMGTHINIKL